MDSFEIDSIKVEKANAILRYRQLRKITNLFRVIEVCLVLILVSKFSLQLPFAIKVSGEYFRDLSVTLISPRFVFVVGNAIIIILFAKSGQFSGQNQAGKYDETHLYNEIVEKSEKGRMEISTSTEETVVMVDTYTTHEAKVYRRTQSENPIKDNSDKTCRELRRSVTEKCMKSTDSCEKNYSEDDMSNEEFRRAVEAFIARQQRFRREEESMAVVL
ncbi:hypothetical protein PVL29_003009 [Vitis rotundifolia]|uniref:DUF4408 domain-containing protein n=1 Tax=Vitis rotundifolia TaxID=103349 RepID=A0AA39E305_VITRO|nr:hypothetical protein PVL29_003009 [Vitis rotundifolia]